MSNHLFRSCALAVFVGVTAVFAGLAVPATAQAATGDAVLQGTITGSDGAALDELVTVRDQYRSLVAIGRTDASGHYSISMPARSDVHVQAGYMGTGNYVQNVYSGGAFAEDGATSVDVSGTTTLDITVPVGAVVTGTLTGVDGRLGTGSVVADWDYGPYNAGTVPIVPSPGRSSYDAASQTYRLWQLPPATYSLGFSSNDYDAGSRYQWTHEQHVPLASGQTLHKDVTLLRTASLAGTIRLPDGSPAASASITAWNGPSTTSAGTISDTNTFATADQDGHFVLQDIRPGTYSICLAPSDAQVYATSRCQTSHLPYTFDATVTVGANEAVTGWVGTLTPAGVIHGRVELDPADGTAPTALANGHVELVSADVADPTRTVTLDADGAFTLAHIPAGTDTLRITGPDGERGYWRSAPTLELADSFTVTAGQTNQLGTGTVTDAIGTERISGADRFGTAVAVSQALFPQATPDVPVEYIASGTNYADALSAGPAAAAQGGGLLLVTKDAVPSSIADELRRLKPKRIVIAGGPAAVSADVEHQLATITGTTPERRSGDDRYATSLAIDTDAFPASSTTASAAEVFLATGRGFPDALAAGPAAIHLDAPIMLVDGTVPPTSEQRAFLSGVHDVDLVGGTTVITDTVAADVGRAVPSAAVHRLGGDDRFATSVAINQHAFGSETDRAYLATGTGFADALSGGPLAGADDAPLYLTTQTCVPDVVLDDLARVNPNVVTLLGGPTVISEDVLDDLQTCS
ncbi:cell wall-binding repeat-containing protein [Curtobacterium sp. RRHDQ10]|uniref:cell wall-binding repeat-containing protein n=1 Tax=Curtobacterium phyllosphaerae TaxID=3413379 RepID=UPI003BF40FF5